MALLLKGDAHGALARDRAGDERELEDDRPADGLPRARAQGRLRRRARRADREVREGLRPTTSPTSTPSAARPTRRSRGSTRRSSTSDPGLAEIVTENLFDKIHSDPRWLPFLRKIGKAPEQLAKIKFKVTLPR